MEEKVEVLDQYENVIAVFSKEDEISKDKMLNPKVHLIQNGESTFSFQIAADSPKWKAIQNVENLYSVNGHIFSAKFEGAYVETLNEDGSIILTVNCFERQKLLEQQYVKAWNSEIGFETIDDFMVVILSGGEKPLKNGGIEVNPTFSKGSAGYILQGLLYGTGWTVGTVDVEGTFDFESDQVDVYNNVLQVQELYGGILIFDSLNKVVHLRDETQFTNYKGYEVRYKKNMRSSEKVYNNKIVTRLIPLGEAGLNIKSVNSGVIYLENYEYSNQVTYEIINNDSIYEPDQLLRWGQRKLQDMCKPTKELTVRLADLRTQEGHELEEFDLNDVVTVINYDNVENENLRVIGWEYDVFAIYESTVDLGDITLNTTDVFKKISIATNDLLNGNISATKIINNKNGQPLLNQMQEFDRFEEQVTTDLYSDEGTIISMINTSITGVNTLTDDFKNIQNRITLLEQNSESINATVGVVGGLNKVRNSVGFYGNDDYYNVDGSIDDAFFGEDGSLSPITLSSCKVQPASNQTIVHNSINNLTIGNVYTITFKLNNESNNKVTFSMTGTKPFREDINSDYQSYDETTGVVTIIESTENINLKEYVYTFYATGEVTYSIKSETIDTSKKCFYSDLIIVAGDRRSDWQPAQNEIMSSTLKIYYKGIEVTSISSGTKTMIDNLGFSIVDLNATNVIVVSISNQKIYFGKDTKVDGKFQVKDFTFEQYEIDSDTILIIV